MKTQPTPTTAQHFRSGDVVRARTGSLQMIHTCIILEDHSGDGPISCMSYLNFTGSPGGSNRLDVSGYPFKKSWFEKPKPNTWVRCDDFDCLHEKDIVEHLGNVHIDDQHLWDTICGGYYGCEVPEPVKCACEKEHEFIRKMVAAAKIPEQTCSCNQKPIPIVKQVQ